MDFYQCIKIRKWIRCVKVLSDVLTIMIDDAFLLVDKECFDHFDDFDHEVVNCFCCDLAVGGSFKVF